MYGMNSILSEKSPSKLIQDPPLSSIPDPPKTLNIYQFILLVLSMHYFFKYDSVSMTVFKSQSTLTFCEIIKKIYVHVLYFLDRNYVYF